MMDSYICMYTDIQRDENLDILVVVVHWKDMSRNHDPKILL